MSSLQNNKVSTFQVSIMTLLASMLFGCGGGGDGSTSASNVTFTIATTPQSLSASEVERIVAQAEEASSKIGAPATIAVTDRVGNVLAVYQTTGAQAKVNLSSGRLSVAVQGLDGLNSTIPSTVAAISKAITGAYLSSSGNAFSTRTASYIIQEHFPPTINNSASGPLFGVQFSQLPCGDFVTRGDTVAAGPKRSPLGLAGDPGGFPIYKNGVVVGGIGVISDGNYGIDLNPTSGATDSDERIAQSALSGFQAPDSIRSNKISLGGVIASYSNADDSLVSVSATTVKNPSGYVDEAVDTLIGTYYKKADKARAGKAYGNADSGFVADTTGAFGDKAFVITDGSSSKSRFANTSNTATDSTTPSTGASGLTAAEVTQIIKSAIGVANQARAQIRNPLGSPAQVTVSVVDTAGNVLGMARTSDAPIFGADVSLQKARTAAFFTNPNAGASLNAATSFSYFDDGATNSGININLADYVTASNSFGSTSFNGSHAFSARAIGNIARPFFPDGINGNPNGPLSKTYSIWSPFNTGLQLDLVYSNLVTAIIQPTTTATNCAAISSTAVSNGIQIFPGGVPIYRGNTFIGAIGVSGDGVDQDDMVAFLGLSRAGNQLGTGVANAPANLRADNLSPQGANHNLRYVQCPQSPFINSSQQNVCAGI